MANSTKLPQRLIDELSWDELLLILEDSKDNYANIESAADVDVVIGRFQNWMAKHGFSIVDNSE